MKSIKKILAVLALSLIGTTVSAASSDTAFTAVTMTIDTVTTIDVNQAAVTLTVTDMSEGVYVPASDASSLLDFFTNDQATTGTVDVTAEIESAMPAGSTLHVTGSGGTGTTTRGGSLVTAGVDVTATAQSIFGATTGVGNVGVNNMTITLIYDPSDDASAGSFSRTVTYTITAL